MKPIFIRALQLLSQGEKLIIATIIEGMGSMPRHNGSQMLVKEDGSIFETIGGGKMEAEVIDLSKRLIKEEKSYIHHFFMTGKDAAESDLICGGQGKVMLYFLKPEDIPSLEAASENGNGYLVISYVENNETEDFKFFYTVKEPYKPDKEGIRYVMQPVESGGTLHILGAGHVSKEISKIADIVGIKSIVYDDREEFANNERFPFSKCVVLESMEICPHLSLGKEDMVVIVTRGHLYDKNCLIWALETDAGYIGMIGSRRKRDLIYEWLMKNGLSKETLDKVHSPIGLKIGAQTPAEIAVSIVAELIQFRSVL